MFWVSIPSYSPPLTRTHSPPNNRLILGRFITRGFSVQRRGLLFSQTERDMGLVRIVWVVYEVHWIYLHLLSDMCKRFRRTMREVGRVMFLVTVHTISSFIHSDVREELTTL